MATRTCSLPISGMIVPVPSRWALLSSRANNQSRRSGTIVPAEPVQSWLGRYSCEIGMIVPVMGGVMDTTAGLWEQVRARRASLALGQEELAELSGTSVRFIRSLEQGKATVRLDKVQAVLDVLGLELTVRLRASR
jgi:HTH-type transcriptional regulator/antitoxin HipB